MHFSIILITQFDLRTINSFMPQKFDEFLTIQVPTTEQRRRQVAFDIKRVIIHITLSLLLAAYNFA